jgi:hypothetical protein
LIIDGDRVLPYGGSRFNSSKVQRKINQKRKLPRFGNSRNVEMSQAIYAAAGMNQFYLLE